MQKWCKKSPSAHHRTTLSGYIFATKACIDSWKKLVKHHYLHMSSQYSDLKINRSQPTSGWDRFTSLGYPSKFQWVLGLGILTALTSLSGGQPNFARCLAISWADWHYIYTFGGFCPLMNFAACKVHFASKSCVLYWQHYCVALEQWACMWYVSTCLCN